VTSGRCADLSRAAGEALAATATNAFEWLLVELPGSWPRDVSDEGALDAATRAAIAAWQDGKASKVLFIRRPGRAAHRRAVFVVSARETTGAVRRLDLGEDRGLADVDLTRDGVPLDRQLVLVCGHGTRDACCALRGSAVFGALAAHVPPDDLWLSSHHGGHRFAANLLVLPAAIHLGRVAPENAARVVGEVLDGRVPLEHYRGRTAYTARQQAAERAVRESHGLVGVSDLTLVGDDGAEVRFADRSGNEHRAVTEEVDGPLVPASCGAEPERQQHVVARLV
jgi:hypothetical protein